MNIYSISRAIVRRLSATAALIAVVVTAACMSVSPNQRIAEDMVHSARDSYTAGNYTRTIQILHDSNEIQTSSRKTRIEAYKLMAFSYCVIGRITLCRAEFEKVLQLDPHFELSTAEKGHPIWGPAFDAARRHLASS